MAKSANDVYAEWKRSLLRGFTDVDLNVCPAGSVFYLGFNGETIEPLFVSRTLGGELFHFWYVYYLELQSKAPVGTIPKYTYFYAVSPVDREKWAADEFYMETIAKSAFSKPVLGARAYTECKVPSMAKVIELCVHARAKGKEK